MQKKCLPAGIEPEAFGLPHCLFLSIFPHCLFLSSRSSGYSSLVFRPRRLSTRKHAIDYILKALGSKHQKQHNQIIINIIEQALSC